MCTKFYHNRSGFVDCISKNILVCFFGSQCIFRHIANVTRPITWQHVLGREFNDVIVPHLLLVVYWDTKVGIAL